MARVASHDSQGLCPAETETLDNIPDAVIAEAMVGFTEDHQLVVHLSDVEGFGYKEIATTMGTPTGTVMSRLNRGRVQLHKPLAGYATDHGIGGARI